MCENGKKISKEVSEQMIARLQALKDNPPIQHKLEVIGDWQDSLIWCPSQCELSLKYGDKNFILYLRWRWDDPWTASVIPVDENFEFKDYSEWMELDIPYFTDEQLDECKEAALKEVRSIFDGM